MFRRTVDNSRIDKIGKTDTESAYVIGLNRVRFDTEDEPPRAGARRCLS